MKDDFRMRVFHIDSECYLLYVGKSPEDYRPFLRLGNSPSLSDEAKNRVSVVILSDSFTGNPLLERENGGSSSDGEIRYVGDTEAVERFSLFLEGGEAASGGETPASGFSQGAEAFVYFYKNGNLRVLHGGEGFFDLHEREEADCHFVFRAEKMAACVRENPLRYRAEALTGRGFFFAGGRPFFFQDGKTGALGLAPGYAESLSKLGFDPDSIETLAQSSASDGLVAFFKRALTTRAPVRIAAPKNEELSGLAALFEGAGVSSTHDVLEAGEEKAFYGFTLRLEGGEASVSFPENFSLLSRVFSGEALPLACPSGEESSEERLFLPVEGVPYILQEKEAAPKAVLQSCLVELCAALKDIAPPSAQGLFESMGNLCEAMGGAAGGAAKLASGLEDFPENLPEEARYLLWNFHEFARFTASRLKPGAAMRKNSKLFASRLPAAGLPRENAAGLPFTAVLQKSGEEVYVFYRLDEAVSRRALSQARSCRARVEALALPGRQEFFAEEQKRFEAFIGELAAGTEKKPASFPSTAEKKKPAERKHPRSEGMPLTEEESRALFAVGAPPQRKRAAGKRKPLLFLLLAALAGLVVFLLVRGGGEVEAKAPPAREEVPAARAVPPAEEEPIRPLPYIPPGRPLELADVYITIQDIRACVNEIAQANGYSPLGNYNPGHPNPHWIYPGGKIKLPGGAVHSIKRGDTLWAIAESYIREDVRALSRAYGELEAAYRGTESSQAARGRFAAELRKLQALSRSENLRRLLEEKVKGLLGI
jgi:hypothetical protein